MNEPSRSVCLRGHHVVLRGQRVTLRPMSEDDWPTLLRWNQDPDVLLFADGNDVETYSLQEVQAIYRGVCAHAYCFVIERAGPWRTGEPIGDCWLQEMNLPRLLDRFPDEDLRRIDLMIGEKMLWGQGLGTETIGLLTAFAFLDQRVDRVFGCDIADYNPRSLRAFEKNDYDLFQVVPQPGRRASPDRWLNFGRQALPDQPLGLDQRSQPDQRTGVVYDLMLTRERYLERDQHQG